MGPVLTFHTSLSFVIVCEDVSRRLSYAGLGVLRMYFMYLED